ncbi:MAG: hypothetical protein LUQ64_01295 [Methanomicrobiales archaeon]|nr:hypothetical protein [Methanomicrobiales archaeon]
MDQLMKCGITVLLLALLATAGSAQLTKTVLNNPVPYGGTAAFRIQIHNDVGGWLTNVQTVDPLVPACSNDWWGDIPPGATVFYDCYAPGVTETFVNEIIATGYSAPNAFRVSAFAKVIVTCTPDFQVSLEPETQSIAYGGTATWTVKVKNTGTCVLSNVWATDNNAALYPSGMKATDVGCSKKIGTLGVGQESSFTCSQANVIADFRKVVMAYATDPDGNTATRIDDARVTLIPCFPAISLTGTPAAQFVDSGGSAKWKITVTNTGDTDLTGVAISGAVCKKSIASLKTGASSTYSCSKSGYKRGTKNNMYTYVLTAKGSACGKTVSAKDSLWVTVKP